MSIKFGEHLAQLSELLLTVMPGATIDRNPLGVQSVVSAPTENSRKNHLRAVVTAVHDQEGITIRAVGRGTNTLLAVHLANRMTQDTDRSGVEKGTVSDKSQGLEVGHSKVTSSTEHIQMD
jgi:hypothetical protein